MPPALAATLWRWLTRLLGVVPCPRCGVLLQSEKAETCWYCGAGLCLACWEALGHCGHPEAEAINAAGRARGTS